ncbi:MAG TPA: UPF0158 family protein [Candidatus Acidoferrales bacterium]|nr:UPF0158 family protein [Candidatus Acidoferrales bacterium]
MAAKANLKAIIDALEMQTDDSRAYFDLDTGEVYQVSLAMIGAAEEGEEEPDIPEWQEDEWELAQRIVASDRILRLPTKHDIHEWEIMKEFAESVKKGSVSDDLQDAIHGPGAFRSFKSALRRHRIEQDWYHFRDEALRDIAAEWCEDNGIPTD